MSDENPYLAPRPKYRDAEWLHEQHHEKGKTVTEMAEMADTSHSTIRYEMDRRGVERRPTGRDLSIAKGIDDKLRNPVWLFEQYWVEGKPTTQLAEELDVSQKRVWECIRGAGIETRSPAEAQYHRRAMEKEQDTDDE